MKYFTVSLKFIGTGTTPKSNDRSNNICSAQCKALIRKDIQKIKDSKNSISLCYYSSVGRI